jgi:demethylmenaquinone methyltransferase/2-methoxy-6-polyprenyl-1,4-benzoquinol methylase
MDLFDRIAPLYDGIMGPGHPKRLRRALNLPTEGSLLDAGGGTGRISFHLVRHVSHVVICDLSFPMLVQARRKCGLMPVKAHAEKLPFPDHSFDRVLVVDALHHFCDQICALTDLLRVLKPGGRLLIEEPDIESFPVKLVALMERMLRMNSRFLSQKSLRRIIESLGVSPRFEKGPIFRFWMIIDKPPDYSRYTASGDQL